MNSMQLEDLAPPKQQFLSDVLDGLSRAEKSLPCKYFYDERGSRLFERICELDEYYLTRTEIAILRRHGSEMAERLGGGCAVIEYGSGSGVKTEILLECLDRPAAYVPVEISGEHLRRTAAGLARRFPRLRVHPVCADFTRPFSLPPFLRETPRRNVFFPGSTIGNFSPLEATELLEHMADLVGEGGGLLIGVDLLKPREIVEPAYNDALGVTAAFNLNLLRRINRELGTDFDLQAFRHRAVFNARESRIEIHLVSLVEQTVSIDGTLIHFDRGETIHTENSYKYSVEAFRAIAESAGFTLRHTWFDPRRLFSVQYLTVR